MGMTLSLRRAGDEQLQALLDQPEGIHDFLRPPGGRPGFGQVLSGPPGADGPMPAEISLDKSWHAIHYLLTGQVWEGEPPASCLLMGGREIGPIDLGFGPARAVLSDEVEAFHGLLSQTDAGALKQRYDPAAMANRGVYPDVIWERESEEAFEYVRANYEVLRAFVAAAAEEGSGLVIWMT